MPFLHIIVTRLSCSAIDYDYILFWNSLWTIAPVIGIGIFDRFLGESGTFSLNFLTDWRSLIKDSHVLMAVPELYRYGREGHWYNQTSFVIYMFDGLVQVGHLTSLFAIWFWLEFIIVCNYLFFNSLHICINYFTDGRIRCLSLWIFNGMLFEIQDCFIINL